MSMPQLLCAPELLGELTQQEWMWSGGLIELGLLAAALLGAVWLVGRRSG
jgi:hypothetical protein